MIMAINDYLKMRCVKNGLDLATPIYKYIPLKHVVTMLKTNKLVVAERKDLVSSVVGGTAIETNKVIKRESCLVRQNPSFVCKYTYFFEKSLKTRYIYVHENDLPPQPCPSRRGLDPFIFGPMQTKDGPAP